MQECEQVMEFASGNEMASMAIRQIGYDLMGYYPITPSTQIAENLDLMKAEGKLPAPTDCSMPLNSSRYNREPDIPWS